MIILNIRYGGLLSDIPFLFLNKLIMEFEDGMDNSTRELTSNKILKYLHHLEWRISNIEAHLSINWKDQIEKPQDSELTEILGNERRDALELSIGENWFPKVGIIILVLGVIFLLLLPYENLPPYLPTIIGFVLAAIFIFLSSKWKSQFENVSKYVFGGSLIILYFSVMRLYYFADERAIQSEFIIILLLTVIVLINLFLAVLRKSIFIASFNLVLGCLTLLLSDSKIFALSALIMVALFSLAAKIKLSWDKLLPVGLVLTYITFLFILVGNPIVSGKFKLMDGSILQEFFLLIYIIIFAAAVYFNQNDYKESNVLILSTLLNTSLGFGLFLLLTLSSKSPQTPINHYIASAVFLTISALYWTKYKSQYSTFFYAIFGYTSLSVGIILMFSFPTYFVVLSWQSLLVISTAIWFRSKFIIVANFVIYLIIFIAFLILAGEVSLISLSFGVVALVSARILNWQKKNLELKTEMMRNAYLTSAFFIIPYSLYHSVPKDYLILSWLGVSLFYYVMSRVLQNFKYRWMGHLTLIITVFYTLIIGTVELEPVLRVITFIITGITLIVISLVYTKSKLKNVSQEQMNKSESPKE